MVQFLNPERPKPTKDQLIDALFNPWVLFDLLQFHGGAKAFGQCHRDLARFAWDRSKRRKLILMARGHLKTTLITVGGCLHDVYVNPNIRNYIGSAGRKLSGSIMRELSANLEDEWAQDNIWNNRPHFPGTRLVPLMDRTGRKRRDLPVDYDDDQRKVLWRRAEAIQVLRTRHLKEPTFWAGSVESPETGGHPDNLYFDDILNFENYDTPEKIARLDRWRRDMMSVIEKKPRYDEELHQRLMALVPVTSRKRRGKARQLATVGNQIKVVGTLYFKHDWYMQLMKKELEIEEAGQKHYYRLWNQNIYKNGENANDGYLWKEEWDEDVEAQVREDVGSNAIFAAQYLNKIIISEDQVIPFENIRVLSPNCWKRLEGSRDILVTRIFEESGLKETLRVTPKLALDPAATANKDSDYTAIAVGGADKYRNLYIFEGFVGKWTTNQYIEKVFELLRKYKLHSFHLEVVGFQATVAERFKDRWLHDKTGKYYPVTIHFWKPPRNRDKHERIEAGLQPLISNGKLWRVPWLGQNTEIVNQFDYFGKPSVKDDFPDVVEILSEICKPKVVSIDTRRKKRARNKYYGGSY